MFSSLLTIIVVSMQLAADVQATPAHMEHSTHRTRSFPNGNSIKTYHPKSHFETYNNSPRRRALSSKFDPTKFQDAGLKFVHSKFGSADDEDDMEVVSSFDDAYGSHVWVRQKVAGIPVANTLANVVQDTKGDVLSYSSNFISPKSGNSFRPGGGYNTKPKLTPDQAALRAMKTLGGRRDLKRKAAVEFFAIQGDDLKLTHSLPLKLDNGHFIQAYVDAEDGTVHGILDFTTELSARVVPLTARDVTEAHEMLNDLEDLTVSPKGWTFAEAGDMPAGMTLGNNIVAASLNASISKDISEQDFAAQATKFTSPGTFDYTVNLGQDPTTRANRDAAVVNVWYLSNMAHDILYRYGFTEKTFNFQVTNPEGQGIGDDPVVASVQDVSDTNNAQFSTFADGQPGIMMTFLWTDTIPMRDDSLDNPVILHEYAHGLTNRMTGGGTGQCLQTTESGGLGEGWSDAFANWIWQSQGDHIRDFTVGGFSSGNETGTIRQFPYSVMRAINPNTYADAGTRHEVHDIGEVWAQTLHNVHANLVREFGAAADALMNPDGDNGHAVFMRLFVGALPIQPCNPTFIDARDAIIQADHKLYEGKHVCALWIGFAYMGLGDGAADFVNSHNVPAECTLPV
ncbi:Fungalysin metallopeptidase-domain-containing protein [Auriculariales sp. MPI-PUGE-AT-0066]|nr:Fungalysin metallopeptidase-domain-containing protein [Auriculariales sp. MPI-PUGE-AT-0066]